jgi:hypothetical protein
MQCLELYMPQTFNVGARSIFVTATAWLFIALAIIASASVMLPNSALGSLLPASIGASKLLAEYLPWIVAGAVLLSLATIASAIGLLLRLDWARRAFIGLVVVALVANLLGLWLQQEILQSVAANTLNGAALAPQAAGVLGGFVTAARVLAVVVTLGACSLLAWIIRRLMSPSVRQEFA